MFKIGRLLVVLTSVMAGCILAMPAFAQLAGSQAARRQPPDALAALRSAQFALDRGRPEEAQQTLQPLLEEETFTALIPHNQQSLIFLMATANARLSGCDVVLAQVRQAAQASQAGEHEWNVLLAQSYVCEEFMEAAGTLEKILHRYPHAVRGLSDQTISRLSVYLSNPSDLSFLLNDGWDHQLTLDLSWLRLRLVRLTLAAGDVPQAATVAHEMAENGRTDLGSLVEFTVDKTFDPIRATDSQSFSFNAMSNRQLANAEADQVSMPGKLELVNALAETLFARGRMDEARIVVDDALSRIHVDAPGHPTFADQDANLNWTHDLKARILQAQGNAAEAEREMSEATTHSEDGRENVSQTLNQIGMLVNSQPEAALAALERFNPLRASPYGRAVARQFRVCAYANLGDQVRMRAAFADVVAHAQDSLMIVQSSAICAGDLDVAASAFIQQLGDPTYRRQALLSVQTYLDTDLNHPDPVRSLLQRQDVRAAFERSAVVRSFPIRQPY
jgi:tetratricopeptide (TPR) repeat protein